MPGHKVLHDVHGGDPLKDPGASGTIYVDRSPCYVGLSSAAAETRTLARPVKRGAVVTLAMEVDGGDITVTITGGINEDGDTTFVFSDPGQNLTLVACATVSSGTSTLFWRKVSDYALGNATPTEAGALNGLLATVDEINAATDVSGRLVSVGDVTTYAVLAANSSKTHTVPDLTGTCTFSMPAESAGLEYKFVYRGVTADAQNWVFDTGSDLNYFIGGLTFIDHDTDVNAPIAGDGNSNSKLTIVTPTVGTEISFICDGTLWVLSGHVNSATIPSFADQ